MSRSFSSLQDIVGWLSHFSEHSGKFIGVKGVFPSEELEALPAGVKFEQKITVEVPKLEAQRHLIILSKD